MAIADLIQPIINALQTLCYVVLLFYLAQVLSFVCRGKTPPSAGASTDAPIPGRSHRLREAMALGYTGVAAYSIYFATNAIRTFTSRALSTGTQLNTPVVVNQIVVIASALICVAFICNFCRSLWMLKLLDHAIFEPVKDWDTLTSTTKKRLPEFFTRAAAALLFIGLERQLEKLGSATPETQVVLGARSYTHLSSAGLFGLFLYLFLMAWWLSGKYLIGAAMPKSLFFFYFAGCFNSFFIFVYGGENVSVDSAWLMILVIALMGVAALWMIGVVLGDLVRSFSHAGTGALRWLFSRGSSSGPNLADA
jgi:hypothetical protein